jgi:hypothetical protein
MSRGSDVRSFGGSCSAQRSVHDAATLIISMALAHDARQRRRAGFADLLTAQVAEDKGEKWWKTCCKKNGDAYSYRQGVNHRFARW